VNIWRRTTVAGIDTLASSRPPVGYKNMKSAICKASLVKATAKELEIKTSRKN
jgi:hypothetical protein